MKWLDRILGRAEWRSLYGADPYFASFAALRGGAVTAETAESVSAVYACVQAISETVASLPLILYRRTDDGGRERAPEHPLYEVLHGRPNAWQSALEFREQLQSHVLLRGNAFAEIRFGYDGQVRELLPLHPDRVTVLQLESGRLAYDVADRNGRRRRMVQDEILHLKHRADNGVIGKSPIQAARETVHLARAEREHGIATFSNGTRLSGILKYPGKLNEEQRQLIRNSWNTQHAGGENSGKTAILEEGIDFTPVQMKLEDAQWIAARQFSVEEVCRLFRVPPTMVGDLRHGNYSNTLELARHFVVHTLRRHLVMWEQAISLALLTDRGRRLYFAEHSVEGLLRGDSTTRASFYSSGIKDGWLLRSEVRQLENLPAIEGMDRPATV